MITNCILFSIEKLIVFTNFIIIVTTIFYSLDVAVTMGKNARQA